MNKKLKTGLIVLIVTALAGSVFYKFYPFSNEKKVIYPFLLRQRKLST